MALWQSFGRGALLRASKAGLHRMKCVRFHPVESISLMRPPERIPYRGTSLTKKTLPLWDPTVGLRLGSWGGHRGVGVFLRSR